MSILIDSYSEAFADVNLYIKDLHPTAAAVDSAIGQCFTSKAGHRLRSVRFYLKKVLNPVGHLVAVLYAMTGTYGTDGKPTGAALATSDVVEMASLGAGYALITFTFPAPYYPMNGGYYCISCECSEKTTLDAANHVGMFFDNTAGTHSGNVYDFGSSVYFTYATKDAPFYVYGDKPIQANLPKMAILGMI